MDVSLNHFFERVHFSKIHCSLFTLTSFFHESKLRLKSSTVDVRSHPPTRTRSYKNHAWVHFSRQFVKSRLSLRCENEWWVKNSEKFCPRPDLVDCVDVHEGKIHKRPNDRDTTTVVKEVLKPSKSPRRIKSPNVGKELLKSEMENWRCGALSNLLIFELGPFSKLGLKSNFGPWAFSKLGKFVEWALQFEFFEEERLFSFLLFHSEPFFAVPPNLDVRDHSTSGPSFLPWAFSSLDWPGIFCHLQMSAPCMDRAFSFQLKRF